MRLIVYLLVTAGDIDLVQGNVVTRRAPLQGAAFRHRGEAGPAGKGLFGGGVVDAVVARPRVGNLGRSLGAGEGWSSGVEAEVVEDALRHRGLGDEGDELEPATAGA